jgi:uncharacterized membrane protein
MEGIEGLNIPMSETRGTKKILHELFEVSVILKGIYGVAEIILGTTILFFSRHFVTRFLLYFVQGELNDNPRNGIANQILHLSNQITPSSEIFMGIYFLFYGILKIVLVTGLLLNREWAYPSTIIFMTAFMGYEIYRVNHTHSVVLMFLIALDAAVIALVWHEYGTRRRKSS